MRLFLAIPFPDSVRNVLLDAQAQLRAQGIRANFSRPENFHLTLFFLGETSRQRDIQRVMTSITAPAFSMTIGGIGRFGDLYWAGVDRNIALESLVSCLRDSLRALGFAIEDRPFRPHITLARQVDAVRPLELNIPKISMAVDRILLMKSERINGRLTYTPLFEKKLKSVP